MLPLAGTLRGVRKSTIMSLKLKLKVQQFSGKEEEWAMFAMAFESALCLEGVPPPMVDWDERFDQGLRDSAPAVYDLLDLKVYQALVTVISTKATDICYVLLHPSNVRQGRKSFRALRERYQPNTIASRMALHDELGGLEMGDMSPMEYFAKARYLRGRLASQGEAVADGNLLSRLLQGLPDAEGYRVVARTIRCMVTADLDEAERRLQAEYDSERAARKNGKGLSAYAVDAGAASAHGSGKRGTCNYCRKSGHWERDCAAKKAGKKPAAGSIAELRNKRKEKRGGKQGSGDSDAPADGPAHGCYMEAAGEPEGNATAMVAAGGTSAQRSYVEVLVDSGANRHVIDPALWPGCDVSTFMSSVRQERVALATAHPGEGAYASGIGDLHVRIAGNGAEVKLDLWESLIVPHSGQALLLSASKLVAAGGELVLTPGAMSLVLPPAVPGGPRVVVPLRQENGLYKFRVRGYSEGALRAGGGGSRPEVFAASVSLERWHQRLGHLNLADMRRLAGMKGSGLELPDGELPPCETCHLGKATHQSHPPRAAQGATAAGQVWHSDTAGPYEERGHEGSWYSRVFVDEHTRYHVVYCRRSKADMAEDVERLRGEVLAPKERHLFEVHLDGPKEFRAASFKEHSISAGYNISYSAPYTHESNGIAERALRTLHDKARCEMLPAALPGSLWPFALRHAAYLINRSPHSALGGKTPFEAWTGQVPDLSKLKVFGSFAYVCAEGEPGKFTNKAWRGRLMGYSEDTKGGYLVYNERTRQVVTAFHVTFREGPDAAEEPAAGPEEGLEQEPGQGPEEVAGEGVAVGEAADAAAAGQRLAAGEGDAAAVRMLTRQQMQQRGPHAHAAGVGTLEPTLWLCLQQQRMFAHRTLSLTTRR